MHDRSVVRRTAPAPYRCSARPSARTCAAPSSARRPRGAGRPRTRATARPTAELWEQTDAGRARPAGPRRPARATGSASGRPTATSGWSSSTPPRASARSWSTSTRPTRRAELEYALQPVRASACCCWRARSAQSDYVGMLAEVRGRCPDLRAVDRARRRLGRAARATPTSVPEATSPSAKRRSSSTTPINIQYTSGTTGFPKGATLSHHNILNNGFFIGEALRLHRAATGSASRCRSTTASAWCWATWPAPRTARAWSSPARLRAAGRAGDGPGRALHRRSTACRRCSSRELDHPRFERVRPLVAAHRHHGRLALPGRGDEARSSRRCTCPRSPSATA